MFIFFLYDSDETEFFSDLSVDFTVHMEELLRGFAVSEGCLELLFDFATDCLELFAFIDIGHIFGEDVDTGFFKYSSRSWYLMLIDFVGFGEFGDEELVCAAFDKKILIDLLCSEGFRLNEFALGKLVKGFEMNEEAFFEHL